MEILPVSPAVAFQNALQDANMLQPNSIGTAALFDSATYTIRQESEGSANNGDPKNFTSPTNTIYIVLSTPYGKRISYQNADSAEDWLLSMRIRIYGGTGADLQDTHDKMVFAMTNRSAVFSSYNICEIGIDEHPRIRPYDKIGFTSMDYTIRFRYALQSS